MNLGEKIKAARAAKDMSQKDLARATGVSERTIQNYELGTRLPRKPETYTKLADTLGVPVDSLMDDEATFVLQAGVQYGRRGRELAEEVVRNFRVAAAGGEMDDDDLDFIKEAMMQTYQDAKAYNQRFRNKRYSPSEDRK